MSNEIQTKVLRAMELAMLINPTSTQKKLTGDKPTVFVWFSGHCNCLRIEVHPEGWEPDYDISDGIEYYKACLEDDDEGAKKVLDEAIERLEGIYRGVLEGKYNG